MIIEIEVQEIPGVSQPIKHRRPETAYARRQMQEFLSSDYRVAEVRNIPVAYNITRLYGSLQNAAWTLCDRPREVRVIRRGSRLFLERRDPWGKYPTVRNTSLMPERTASTTKKEL